MENNACIFPKFINIIFNISILFHYVSVAWFAQMLTQHWTESLRLVLMHPFASALWMAKPNKGN